MSNYTELCDAFGMDANDADALDNLIDGMMLRDEQYYASYWVEQYEQEISDGSFEDFYWMMTGIPLMDEYDDRT